MPAPELSIKGGGHNISGLAVSDGFPHYQTRSKHQRLLISADPREKPRRYDAKKAVAVKPVVDDLLKISEKTGIPFEISWAT